MINNNRFPNLFIVGAPKCGTTSMADYLRQHKSVFVPEEKEFFYFGAEGAGIQHPMSKARYLRSFASWHREKYALDATPFYLYIDESLEQIKNLRNESKIIVMLRSPSDLIYSLYSEMKFSGAETSLSFCDAISKTKNSSEISTNYIKIGHFTHRLKKCFELFGKDRVHVILFDDLKNDTSAEIFKVQRFLSIKTELPLDTKPKNPNKKAFLPKLNLFLQHPPEWMGKILGIFFPHQVRFKVRRIMRELNTIKVEREAMDPRIKKSLKSYFEEDIIQLSELLGRDLSDWNSL